MNARWNLFLFEDAVNFLIAMGGKIVVEIGGIRDLHPNAPKSDGHATVHWSRAGFEVHTVDIDEGAVSITRRLVKDNPIARVYLADGLEFLKGFPRSIDLLYLDGPDASFDEFGQQFHLNCYRECPVKPPLILIDDCDELPKRWVGRGKGSLVIPAALGDGYEVLKDNGRQVLLRKGPNVDA